MNEKSINAPIYINKNPYLPNTQIKKFTQIKTFSQVKSEIDLAQKQYSP